MKRVVGTIAVFLILAATVIVLAGDGNPKVSDDIGVRIRNIQLDISRKQADATNQYIAWLTSPQGKQYDADQQTIQHDQGELNTLKTEALSAAKLDAKDYDVDVEKLEFVAKPKAPEAKK